MIIKLLCDRIHVYLCVFQCNCNPAEQVSFGMDIFVKTFQSKKYKAWKASVESEASSDDTSEDGSQEDAAAGEAEVGEEEEKGDSSDEGFSSAEADANVQEEEKYSSESDYKPPG